MPEQITLTTPIVVSKTTTGLRVAVLHLEPENSLFVLVVSGTNGDRWEARRNGGVAMTLMSQLNSANGTIKTLQRRALEWFLTQPEGADLQGSITGTPD
jgi:hypothetical protein